MGWADEARRKATQGGGGFRPQSKALVGANGQVMGGPADGVLARDRFGRPIDQGDLVLYRPPQDMVFQVERLEILPQVDPRMATGGKAVVQMLLSCEIPLQSLLGMANVNLVVIGSLEKPAGVQEEGPRVEEVEEVVDPGVGTSAVRDPGVDPSPASEPQPTDLQGDGPGFLPHPDTLG